MAGRHVPSWKDGKLGLPVRDAIAIFPELELYTDERGRLDLSNRRARILYNTAVAKLVFGIDIRYHPRGLVTPPVSRYIFLKTFLRGGETVLEIGTGHTAMMAIMAELFFNCRVTATEIDPEFFRYAVENIKRNGAKVRLIKSNGAMIRGVIPEGELFDVIFSAPPYYERLAKGVLTEIEGLGGGMYGEEFSVMLLKESRGYLKPDGKVALFLPDKEPLLEAIIEEGNRLGYSVRDVRFRVGRRWRHALILQT